MTPAPPDHRRPVWLVPVLSLTLTGCRGPTAEQIGVAILVALPAGWLAFGILRWLLGRLKADWAEADWRGWQIGLLASGAVALAAGLTADRHRDLDLVPLALLSSVPSAVAFTLLLWRLLWRPGDRAVWVAPLIVMPLYALLGLLLRLHAIDDDLVLLFVIYTGFFWAGPAVALLILWGVQLVKGAGRPPAPPAPPAA